MKVAFVGYGSISRKHISILEERGLEPLVISRRSLDINNTTFLTIRECLESQSPDIVWVCNETSLHEESLNQLADCSYSGIVLVEKPIGVKAISSLPSKLNVYVTYNLRFHPLLERLNQELSGQKIVAASAYVGQYLPEWRPGTDYRESYSSKVELGGGALRDLSHEVDFLFWLIGQPDSVVSQGGKISPLEISSDDYYTLTMKRSDGYVANLIVNYLDRVGQRNLTVHTEEHTYFIDFMSGLLMKDKESLLADQKTSSSYEKQIDLILEKNFSSFCSFQEANQVMNFIEKVEESNKTNNWVTI